MPKFNSKGQGIKLGANAKGQLDPSLMLSSDSAQAVANEKRIQKTKREDVMDSVYGFESASGTSEVTGWLYNMHPADVLDDSKRLVSAMKYYFLKNDGSRFKVTLPFRPYFLVAVKGDQTVERDVTTYLLRKYANTLAKVEQINKDDLDAPNHLIGLKASYLKLLFFSVSDLTTVRRDLLTRIRKNKQIALLSSSYTDMLAEHFSSAKRGEAEEKHDNSGGDTLDNLVDMREFDVPYTVRVSIDLNIFCAHWYVIRSVPGLPPSIQKTDSIVTWPEPVVLAFDIETTKLPLKFPDSALIQVMMISYMIDGLGYLLCNREIISQDIQDFEFTPKPEFAGPFKVKNLPNERGVIEFFFDHIRRAQPSVITTYNGDGFDWPFVEARAKVLGLDMREEIGFDRVASGPSAGRTANSADYLSLPCAHLDCLRWVKRDSYLPVGAHGLKAVTKAKLNYNPVEVEPEAMCRMAVEDPVQLANYSVSDAVATYYLYMKYVHPFVFALCTILPLNPDDVLRKGSGTLCETLLMVEAYRANVVFPLKQASAADTKGDGSAGLSLLDGAGQASGRFTEDGHLIQSETYVGGHVEALECGVFRADIPIRFRLVPAACESLRSDVRRCVRRGIAYELGSKDDSVCDELVDPEQLDKVVNEVKAALRGLSTTPNRLECPVIYHLDVGAMYPNIILTNRLQPSAVAADANERCSGCHFYRPGVSCQRFMPWTWRAELWTASRTEVYRMQAQLHQERFPSKHPITGRVEMKAFHELSKDEQVDVEKKRMSDFCRRAYKRVHTTRVEQREAMVCQRENSFYVDTVRAFRDRRYKFKGLTKVWKRRQEEAGRSGDPAELKEASSMVVLYDSLQLAHKCILNSFYGYVMRRGARWYSMEMAGIVCHTGANIITRARELIEQVGRALELDTDGIWCVLPASFPQNFNFDLKNGKKLSISYPGCILNLMVQDFFTNDQYHELVDAKSLTYKIRAENSIFFEVDGPYLAMVLPAAKEEGKKLKKRYAVFNFDGTLAELKGFEIKRNGELQLIKIFQSSVFEAFLRGKTLQEVYASVAKVADYWLDVLYSKGRNMCDEELFELISENRSMSRKLADYEGQKSTSISTAKRLAEFLGDAVVKDAGLSCKFVISRQPEQAPVTERAIPLAIFQAEPSVRRHFMRKWLKDPTVGGDVELRDILDWSYYLERLGSAIQKIITIPAALQQVPNPVPRVVHPDWLAKKLAEKSDTFKQRKLTDMMDRAEAEDRFRSRDLEELNEQAANRPEFTPRVTKKRRRSSDFDSGPPKPWREQLPELARLTWDELTSGEAIEKWITLHMQKWRIQKKRRKYETAQEQTSGGDSSANVAAAAKRQKGMAGYLSMTKMALKNATWQVVEMVPDRAVSGQYTLMVLIQMTGLAPSMHSLKIRVPRRFYVNIRRAKKEDSGPLFHKVSDPKRDGGRVLPRSHLVHYLYEYSVPEEVYQAHAADIATDLASPDTAGVYEANVPPLFNALVSLGCLCSLKSSTPGAKSDQEASAGLYNLDQLQFRSLVQHPYLEFGSLRTVFLFHYQQSAFNPRDTLRQMYILIVPWMRRGFICAVDTVKVNTQLRNLTSAYAKQLRELGLTPETTVQVEDSEETQLEESEDVPETETPAVAVTDANDVGARVPKKLAFQVSIETEATVARKQVQKWFAKVAQGKQAQISSAGLAPLAVLLHAHTTSTDSPDGPAASSWPLGKQLIGRRRSPQLPFLDEVPVIPIGGIGEENEQQSALDDDDTLPTGDAYSLLNWQQTALRRGFRYFIQSELRYRKQLELARYLHIPVGNVPVNNCPVPIPSMADKAKLEESMLMNPSSSHAAIELGCDLFFARHLTKQGHIWWCNTGDQPDLGGKETDDQRLLLDLHETDVAEVNRRGCYANVSVEVEVGNLAVNTMLIANRIPELEGATLLTFDNLSASVNTFEDQMTKGVNPIGANITSYDETAACSPAFKVLRTMVIGWVKDVTQYRNALADEQIMHFYQWLRSPSSLFYDPALRRTLQKMMKKIFLKMVDEIGKAHVDVIYGSFNRLVLSAKRPTLAETVTQVDALARLIRGRAFFSHLDFQITNAWSFLMWMDAANYAGVQLSLDAACEPASPSKPQSRTPRRLVDLDEDSDFEEDVDVYRRTEANPNMGSDDERDATNKENEDPEEDAKLEFDMHWHLARYLPQTRGLRMKFQAVITAYIVAIFRSISAECERIRQITQSRKASGGSGSSQAEIDDCQVLSGQDFSMAPVVQEYAQRFVRDELAPELFGFLQKLKIKSGQWYQPHKSKAADLPSRLAQVLECADGYLAEKNEVYAQLNPQVNDLEAAATDVVPLLPPHPDAYSGHFTPLVDFVKSVCEVLSLHKLIEQQVTNLRQDLLRLVGVGEFSTLAQFRMPHEFVCVPDVKTDTDLLEAPSNVNLLIQLSEVVCPACNSVRDLDICRDQNLINIQTDLKQGQSAVFWTWACPYCNSAYSRAKIESQLINQLEQLALRHCLQDLQCSKCTEGGGIQENLLAQGGSRGRCANCAAALKLTVPAGKGFSRLLSVYAAVGHYFGLRGLTVHTNWLLSHSKTSI